MSRDAASRLLALVAAAGSAFGLAFVIFPGTTENFFYWMIFGASAAPDSFSAEAQDYIRFAYGVLGAVMAGWLALVVALALGPIRRGEGWAWQAVAGSLAFWFVVDTTHSLATGYPENALFNLGFALAFAVPLWALRPRAATRA